MQPQPMQRPKTWQEWVTFLKEAVKTTEIDLGLMYAQLALAEQEAKKEAGKKD